MSDVRWRRRAALVLACLAFGGTTVGADSCTEAQEDLEDVSGENDKQYASKIKQLEIGMSKSEVRSIMGQKPRDIQTMEGSYGTSEFWYYGSYQLAFQDGKLESKNKY